MVLLIAMRVTREPARDAAILRKVFHAARLLVASIAFGVAAGSPTHAGETAPPPGAWPPDAILRGATLAGDLTFPGNADAVPASRKMVLLKPPGNGPFPALVIVHQCGGLNESVYAVAKQAVDNNYVALVIDAFGPRGVASVCYGPQAGVNLFRGARDALQAAEHLRRLPYVDGRRVAMAGFSWGAMVGLLASSRHYAAAVRAGNGFAAVVSFYPGCFHLSPPNGRPPYDTLNPDITRPLLVLMGGADTETPATDCVQKLQAIKTAGAPVEWHVYPDTTHCWNCRGLDGKSRTDVRGNHVEYRFSQVTTEDSMRRLFAFLARAMPAP